ncbi:DAPG hydrolase family protein [Vibrio sp. 10N.261.51.F12]|uniref:DAPG hydrolase family protein n=1 Tax=Vibrio sp. 10N.261.51.F12 TaxID=3229679 RepID=UPI00354E7719
MKKYIVIPLVIIAVFIAVFGVNPWATANRGPDVLSENYSEVETGVYRAGNGILVVKALTRMPNVEPEMVRWWFADYMETTEHYQSWYPTEHVWMDWENKKTGEHIGASHLVDEYIGDTLNKLRIQFVEPSEILNGYKESEDRFVICAYAGLREELINASKMCHIVTKTEYGSEMRSVFWQGYIEKRNSENQNETVFSIEGLIGNTALARTLIVNKNDGIALMGHAIGEMNILAGFLPELYAQENNL